MLELANQAAITISIEEKHVDICLVKPLHVNLQFYR